MVRLSIVVPVYNASVNLVRLVDEIEQCLRAHFDLEIVLVNDYSTDDTQAVAEKITKEKAFVKLISLAYNVGEYTAVMCGLHHVTGDVTAVIDDDSQNPPSEIIKLTDKLNEGYDVVYAKYKKKQHNFFRNIASILNNITASLLTGKPMGLYQSSFKVMTRKTVEKIRANVSVSVYIDRIIYKTTNKISSAEVEHRPSLRGYSTYNFGKLMKLYLGMYSNFPRKSKWEIKK